MAGISFLDHTSPRADNLSLLMGVSIGSKIMSISDGSVWRAMPYCGSVTAFHYKSHFATMLPEALLERYGPDLRLIWQEM